MEKIFNIFTKKNNLLFILLLLLLIINHTPITKITRVIDGDTIVVNDDRVIRLARVDTPEKNQKGYREAKNYMSRFLHKQVKLECEDELGYYGREICEVYYEDKNLNENLLKLKYTKTYRK